MSRKEEPILFHKRLLFSIDVFIVPFNSYIENCPSRWRANDVRHVLVSIVTFCLLSVAKQTSCATSHRAVYWLSPRKFLWRRLDTLVIETSRPRLPIVPNLLCYRKVAYHDVIMTFHSISNWFRDVRGRPLWNEYEWRKWLDVRPFGLLAI